MPSPFAITVASNTVRLDDNRRGEVSFTVVNISGSHLRGRSILTPQDPSVGAWLSVAGESERDFARDGKDNFVVQITAPAATPPGGYPFRLDMVGVANPDELFTEGPTVTIEVAKPGEPPPPPPGKDAGYVTTLLGALVGNLVGAVAGALPGGLFLLFNRQSLGAVIVLALGLLIGGWVGAFLGSRFALQRWDYPEAGKTATFVAIALPILAIILVIAGLALGLIKTGLQGIVVVAIINEVNVVVCALLARFLAQRIAANA